ncbi:hypothetical protein QTQ03_30050 [Micromonospora sp. WMMA1363]|uniref:hypothetical protein n=1 Tax=Micromonospora sp. WMMA1363 TaxID=3053985 RepID=UPI00259C6BF2|nr:hypothetical protein [Micromonospora sp. WMMA1363]MDM4723604.1 hypothetical protein [Micromonospora sp. WMMA1363]
MNAENVRFPGFDALSQQRHWDPVTTGVVLERISNLRDFRFFNPDEQAIATVLCDRLLGQGGNGRIPVAAMIDARLAESQTDGWRYADMPRTVRHGATRWPPCGRTGSRPPGRRNRTR